MSLAHIHPMLVHFPIVLVMIAFLFDAYRVLCSASAATVRPKGPDVGTILMVLAGVAAIAAFIFGDLAYDIAVEHGFREAQLESHEGWGTTTTITLVIIALVRIVMWWRGLNAGRRGRLFAAALTAAGTVMVVVTAYFGGQLVYDLGVNVM